MLDLENLKYQHNEVKFIYFTISYFGWLLNYLENMNCIFGSSIAFQKEMVNPSITLTIVPFIFLCSISHRLGMGVDKIKYSQKSQKGNRVVRKALRNNPLSEEILF